MSKPGETLGKRTSVIPQAAGAVPGALHMPQTDWPSWAMHHLPFPLPHATRPRCSCSCPDPIPQRSSRAPGVDICGDARQAQPQLQPPVRFGLLQQPDRTGAQLGDAHLGPVCAAAQQLHSAQVSAPYR